MPRVIIIMHIESEGPGTIRDYLESINVHIRIAKLYRADPLPMDVNEVDAVIVMGGPMNVFQEDKYPFLQGETAFLRQAIENNIPVLGICLGAQMIARTCGARVRTAPTKEIGWSEVRLTEEGRSDRLFHGLLENLPVFQWHEDNFDLPENGVLLATSRECPHQVFRYMNAYGLQFHVKITHDMLYEWFCESKNRERILKQFREKEQDHALQAEKIYKNFIDLTIRRMA